MKITKLLPITLALVLGMSGAYAATEATNSSAHADYQLQLGEYFNVTAEAPAAAAVAEYSNDYSTINIPTITGTYHVTSNTDTKDIYFYGECLAGEANVPALFGTAAQPKLVFTNTQIGAVNNKALSSGDVAAIRGGVTEATKSPNAIVLNLTITPELVADSFPTGKTISAPTIENGTNVKYSIPNCKAKFTCSVGGGAQDNSFSTLDTNGLYKATLYLSDTAQTL